MSSDECSDENEYLEDGKAESNRKRGFSDSVVKPGKCRKKILTRDLYVKGRGMNAESNDQEGDAARMDVGSKESFPCQITQCNQRFHSVSQYDDHYNLYHRNVCTHCRKLYISSHLLDIHVLETHDTMFSMLVKKKPMFECLEPDCEHKSWTDTDRKEHLMTVHKYPANFSFQHMASTFKKNKQKTKSKQADLKNGEAVVQDMLTEDGVRATDEHSKSHSSKELCDGKTDSNSVSNPERKKKMINVDCCASETLSDTKHAYRVPKNICFGQGSQRSFLNTQTIGSGGKKKGKKKGKHWHQSENHGENGCIDTTVNIEEVKMDDLAGALDGT